MKFSFSIVSTLVVAVVLIVVRLAYTDNKATLPVKVTTWDALGYYMYLPSAVIYHDDTSFAWYQAIEKQYQLSGGELYQVSKLANGRHVYKYLRGVSLMQMPFFYLAHFYASNSNRFPADGFSAPYQYAVAWGALFYCIVALFLLRSILLRYYSDRIVAIALLLLILASNAIQYIAIEGGQSHAYIFPLYVFILYATIKWHECYKVFWVFLIGYIIGLAMISRPTEAIMLFIPLLWQIGNNEAWKQKWQIVKQDKKQLLFVVIGGLLGILPQLLYWKRITGSWVYDVGSKWDFLNPHVRVLVGWEKGWFIYTPVTILFFVGLFLIKNKTVKTSVITFCLLNIYIIIAWHIWRYGGSYSTRALMQSYPIFALPLCASIEYIYSKKIKWMLLPLSAYLIFVNLFQIGQYNKNILHYDDMNRKYYSAIYLNPLPSALDMSLLDTEDILHDESSFTKKILLNDTIKKAMHSNEVLYVDTIATKRNSYMKIHARINSYNNLWGRYLKASLKNKADNNEVKIRLFHPLAKENTTNEYSFYVKLPANDNAYIFSLQLDAENYEGEISKLEIVYLKEK